MQRNEKGLVTGILVLIMLALMVTESHAAVIRVQNLNRDSDNAWAVINSEGGLLGNGMATLRVGASDMPPGQIKQHFREGDLEAIDGSFSLFGEPIAIGEGAPDGFEGMWQVTHNYPTDGMGNKAIDLWLSTGDNPLSVAAEHLFLRFKIKFPVPKGKDEPHDPDRD